MFNELSDKSPEGVVYAICILFFPKMSHYVNCSTYINKKKYSFFSPQILGDKVQEIDNFSKQEVKSPIPEISLGGSCQNSAEVASIPTASIPLFHDSNSSVWWRRLLWRGPDNEGCYYEDKGYYYRNGRYESKVSSMMSPLIFPVYA